MMNKNYDIIIFILKYLYFKKTWSIHFAEIIKIVTVFIKTSLKTQKMLKELEIMYENENNICIF